MITLSSSPEDFEMPLDGFMEEITPVGKFFVRCHTLIPKVNEADWKLRVSGLVREPREFTLGDLRQFPRATLTAVLECAGNGRAFHQPRVAGTQWRYGSVGNATWSGVRLRDILDRCGLNPSATQLLLDGEDVPIGQMPDFQRTIETEKALHPDTLLAWEMNGKPLTPEHGFPLRVIAPGWAGDSWVKWLGHIGAIDHDFEGFWMKSAYRRPARHVEPGVAVDPKDMIPVADLNVKSVIAGPISFPRAGAVTITGMAWSNASPVTKVEVSADNGLSWSAAKLGGTATKYGFRKWTYQWKATEGTHMLMSRATNAAGETQPLRAEWNPSGYLYNAAQPRSVYVGVAVPAEAAAPQPSDGPAVYRATCFSCHDDGMMRQQRLTRPQWDRELNKMTGWGAEVKAEDRNTLLDYLSQTFKP
jgi:DMSO/TMAO reductase YedYZ molybdopterin-dependent catalytic subunit/cytochrome c5